MAFLVSMDVGPVPGYDCFPTAQDCPAGQKCVWSGPAMWGGRRDGARCIEITGSVAPFEPCTLPNGTGPELTDDCDGTSYCLEVYGSADHGFCAPFALNDCDNYPGTIPVFENGSNFPAACLYNPCHPFEPSSCPDGLQCTYYPASLYADAMCWAVPKGSERMLGAPCDFGDCGGEKLCVPAEWLPSCEAGLCCTEWCDLDTPNCQRRGAVCERIGIWGNLDPSLGACVLPGALE